jgi:D-amino-acid dehydrogenase
MKHIVIIGGGITGVTSAYALVKRGFKVTLIEKNRYAAMETSYANGGQLSASNAEVWTRSSTLLKSIKWLFNKEAPLLINLKPTWHKISWFAEFIASIPHYSDNTIKTVELSIAARKYLFSWAEEESIDFDHVKAGILHIYRDKKSFEDAALVSQLLLAGGLQRHPVSPSEMKKIEPTLRGSYYGGYFTESDSTGDIHKFTNGLAQAAERHGVEFLYEHEVLSARSNGQDVTVLLDHQGDQSERHFDSIVICAGVYSRPIAKKLGDRLNIYPVKGYSITIPLLDSDNQKAAPTVSLLDDATKIVSSRLGTDRFRVAGTAEFNGINKDIRIDRITPLINWVQDCFPEVSTRNAIPWAGLRPMMPNMMPFIGKGILGNVYYNTGHGHLGWTMSAATADMIATLIEGEK